MLKKRMLVSWLILSIIIALISGGFGKNDAAGTAYAASAAIVLSCKGATIQKGTDLSVTVTVRSTDMIGQVQMYLSYDETVLKYKKGSDFVSGEAGFVEINDTAIQNTTVRKYSVTFEAVGTGTVRIAVCESPTIADVSGSAMSISSNFISVTAEDGPKKSRTCTLKSLSCQEGELSPAFSSKCYAYEISVGHDVEQVHFNAAAKSKKATAVLTGGEPLKDGKNVIKITVTAEAGNSQDYLITVNRSTLEEEAAQMAKQEGFRIVQEDGKVNMISYHTYTLKELPEESRIPDGFSETEREVNGERIVAYAAQPDEDSTFYLVYASCDGKAAAFYQVDEEEGTLQRYRTEIEAAPEKSAERSPMDAGMAAWLVLGIFFLVFTIIIGTFLKRYRSGSQ